MSWLKSHCKFPARRLILFLCEKDTVAYDSDIRNIVEDAGKLELALRMVIRVGRPELADCTIHYMDFDFSRYGWRIGIEHPSLPVVDDGCMAGEEYLRLP